MNLFGYSDNKIYYEKINGSKYTMKIDMLSEESTTIAPKIDLLCESAKIIYDRQDCIDIYINPKAFKNSQILFQLLSEKSETMQLLENEFEDDNTQNYRAVIKKDDYETLDLIEYLLSKKQMH